MFKHSEKNNFRSEKSSNTWIVYNFVSFFIKI